MVTTTTGKASEAVDVEGMERPSTTRPALTGSALSKFRKAGLTVKAANRFNQLKGHAYDIDGQPVPDIATLLSIANSGRHMAISVDGLSRVDIGSQAQPAGRPARHSSLLQRSTTATVPENGTASAGTGPVPMTGAAALTFKSLMSSGKDRSSAMGTMSGSTNASSVVLDMKQLQEQGSPDLPPAQPPVPPPSWLQHKYAEAAEWACTYFRKWRGVGDTPVGVPPYPEIALTFLATFSTLLLLCALTTYVSPHMADIGWVVTSFGASAVLIFAVPESKLVQPRNFMGGQIIGAVVGTCVRLALQDWLWISGPLATALALTVMQLTKTTHPPGGGTALAIGLSPVLLPWQGFQVVVTVIIGSTLFLLLGLLFNNVSPKRRFPTFWYDQRL